MKRLKSLFMMTLVVSLLVVNSMSIFSATKVTNPSAPTLSYSPTVLTNSAVTVSISYPSSAKIKQYKLGQDGIWMNYSTPIRITSNTNVFARYQIAKGTWSGIGSIAVSNIDVTPPIQPTISASTTLPTTEEVTLTIEYSADSANKLYKLNDGIWINYTAPILVSANATLYAKASDIAGNWSSESSYVINNFTTEPVQNEKIVLGYTVKYSSTDKSSYNSLTANASVINEIATATYSVDGLGNLTGTAPVDQLTFAAENNIVTKLMISNNFDSNIARQLLQNPENRKRLTDSILQLIIANDYKGVDIDIENIPAECRNDFTALMREVYGTLKPKGYGVSVAVQAKTYDSASATWNYAFDYKALADFSDYLMIMTYDEHYPGGAPGAIASINWVTNVVNYSLTVVPKEKIVLGLAAYGYDWSASGTKAYSINGCLNLANQYGATIYFDETTQSKYYKYSTNGVEHTVWFEDGDTIASKLDLVINKDLKGIGIWRLGLENTYFWDVIRSKLMK